MILKAIVNNEIYDKNYKYGWGLSVYISTKDGGLLFDTGPDGDLLLHNLKVGGISLNKIKHIVISHVHLDHTRGLIPLLDAMEKKPTVYIPKSIAKEFQERIERHGGKVVRVEKCRKIAPNVYTTGQLGILLAEQSLYLKSENGTSILTACAHPRISRIVSFVVNECQQTNIYAVIGGFHLMEKDEEYITEQMKEIKDLGVSYIGPTHCSGKMAQKVAVDIFGKSRVINFGAGAIINV